MELHRTKSNYRVLIFVIIFFATLNGFLWGGFPIISLLGFLLGFLLSITFVFVTQGQTKIARRYIWYVIVVISALSFILLGSLLYEIQIDPKRLLGLGVIFITLIISPLLLQYVDSGIIKTIIWIHVLFFYLQFLLYYVFGIYFDYLFIAESYSRNLGGSFILPIFNQPLMRPSGLYAEPGNYANYMFLLYILNCLVGKRNGDKINGILFYLLTLSLVLTFSAFGLVFLFVILLSRVNSLKSFILISLPLILYSIVATPYFIERFMTEGFISDTSGLSFRLIYVTEAMSNFDSVEGWIVGKGTLSAPSFFGPNEGSDNDSGLIFFVLREMGVVVSLLFLVANLFALFRHRLILLSMTCLFIKLTPFMFFVPLFFSCLLFIKPKYYIMRS